MAIPGPIPDEGRKSRTRAVLVKMLRRPTVISEEAIALLCEQIAEVGRGVARRVAVGAEKPGQRRSDARRVTSTALRVRLLVELGTADRGLLQRERRPIRLLRRSQSNNNPPTPGPEVSRGPIRISILRGVQRSV